jgi:general secretion pathway protein G
MKNERKIMEAVKRGFTLVELLVVVAIIGILATGATIYVSGYLDKAYLTKAKEQVGVFATAVNTYKQDHKNNLPKSLSDLLEEEDGKAPYIQGGEGALEDPWGNPYELKVTKGKNFYILSYGPDGQSGTEDDIRNDKISNSKDKN